MHFGKTSNPHNSLILRDTDLKQSGFFTIFQAPQKEKKGKVSPVVVEIQGGQASIS